MSSFEVIEGWEGRRGKGRGEGGGLDLPQVDLTRVSKQAERATKLREVDLSRVNGTKVFICASRQNREWLDSYSGFLVTFGSP